MESTSFISFMNEWALSVHRAIWFPVLYAMALDRPAMHAPGIGTNTPHIGSRARATSKKSRVARRTAVKSA